MDDSFRQLGQDHYTCVPVPGYEKDPSVTAAIREFDPGLIPFWRVQLWKEPGSDTPLRVVHHGIARYYPIPRYLRRPFRIEMPANDRSDPPNFLDAIIEDQGADTYRLGGPGGYLPWDWSLYRWCRWMYMRLTAESWEAFHREKRAREEREYASMLAEIEGKRKELEPYLMRKVDEVSQYGWKQYLRFQAEQDRRRAAGLPAQRLVGPTKTTVALRSPRSGKTFGRVAPAQELGESNAGS
jgi:hypothetical protein